MPVLPSIGTRLPAGWGAYLNATPFDTDPQHRSFGDVLSDQIRFRTVKAGSTSIEDVRPDSAAAAELWKSPAVRDIISGVMELAVDYADGPTIMRGFTLARDEAGYVANRAVHAFKRGPVSPWNYDFGVQDALRHTYGTTALRKGAWFHFGPERSAGLIEVLERAAAGEDPGSIKLDPAATDSLGRGVKTLLHEVSHLGSPRPKGAEAFDWLSEGSAETISRWPGRVEHAGETLGIDVPKDVGTWFDEERRPYQEEVDSVRALLRMSGIDPEDPAHFSAAEQVLNRIPEPDIPTEFARRIADQYERLPVSGNDPKLPRDRIELETQIRDVIVHRVAPDGSHADPHPLFDLASSLGMDIGPRPPRVNPTTRMYEPDASEPTRSAPAPAPAAPPRRP